MLEERRAEDGIERRQAGLQAVIEPPPGPPRAVMADEPREAGQAIGMVPPQKLSHWREPEPASSTFGTQAQAGERPQQPIHAVFRNTGLHGEIIRAPRAFRELVGHSDVDSGGYRLADPLADHHLQQYGPMTF